jgi:hypothetical protein
MRKYKHIPTGKVVTFGGGYGASMQALVTNAESTLTMGDLVKGEDWEEVTEKEWKILSFKKKDCGTLITRKDNDLFSIEDSSGISPEDPYIIRSQDFSIYSVRRESDGTVFTLGDKVCDKVTDSLTNNKVQQITYFQMTKNQANGRCLTVCFKSGTTAGIESLYPSKEWKITAFKVLDNDQIIERGPNYRFGLDQNTEEQMLKKIPKVIIYSVERLSDGVVFKIGDNIKGSDWNTKHIARHSDIISKIYIPTEEEAKGFTFNTGDLVLQTKITWQTSIQKAIKIEKLFTTEDGVDVFKGDKGPSYWGEYPYVNTEDWSLGDCHSNSSYATNLKYVNIIKIFSTREKAKEYILRNKPCLSAFEVIDILEGLPITAAVSTRKTFYSKIIDLAKSRQK